MSHTPGPWSACHDGNCPCRQVWSIPGDAPVFTAKGDSQALIGLAHHKWGDDPQHIYGEIPLSETQANAILIAAAPDLLAVVKELEESSAYWSEYDVPIGLADRIRAAIAKAEGRR